MFQWLKRILFHRHTGSPWSVAVLDGTIVTSDGQGTERRLPVEELQRVVVATDNSGPWGDDVVFLIYAEDDVLAGLFPLEATGCQDFIAWLSNQPGYRDMELAKAMSSVDVARFTVLEIEA